MQKFRFLEPIEIQKLPLTIQSFQTIFQFPLFIQVEPSPLSSSSIEYYYTIEQIFKNFFQIKTIKWNGDQKEDLLYFPRVKREQAFSDLKSKRKIIAKKKSIGLAKKNLSFLSLHSIMNSWIRSRYQKALVRVGHWLEKKGNEGFELEEFIQDHSNASLLGYILYSYHRYRECRDQEPRDGTKEELIEGTKEQRGLLYLEKWLNFLTDD